MGTPIKEGKFWKMENGKLIPIMIPSNRLWRTEAVLLLCSMYDSYSIIQLPGHELLETPR
jgi:hypothetical protein